MGQRYYLFQNQGLRRVPPCDYRPVFPTGGGVASIKKEQHPSCDSYIQAGF